MKIEDIRRYRGYMPIRMEREDVLEWLGSLIGEPWMGTLWKSKYSGYHEVRYRFGDVQEAQLYMKDGTWRGMPIECWLKFSEMDSASLDGECWTWIHAERSRAGIQVRKARASGGGMLDT